MEIKEVLTSNGFEIVETLFTDEIGQQLFGFQDLALSEESLRFLNNTVPEGIYLHQKEAIQRYLDGQNVCLTTRTASGKSLAFYVAGIEELVKDPSSRIIAIYPTRALGNEQEKRWRNGARNCRGRRKGRTD